MLWKLQRICWVNTTKQHIYFRSNFNRWRESLSISNTLYNRPIPMKRVYEFLANNAMTKASYPLWAPDLAPCDFFLFSYLKNQLVRWSIDDADQLLRAIKEVCESIEKLDILKVLDSLRKYFGFNETLSVTSDKRIHHFSYDIPIVFFPIFIWPS
jgi:hypothetical protein